MEVIHGSRSNTTIDGLRARGGGFVVPDIATISAVLSSLKTATDIAKYFRESGFSLEKAEMKLKVADLVNALAEAKLELAQVQDVMVQKDHQIAELRQAFESKLPGSSQ